MWSFCVNSLLAAPCLPQWICLTFAWDDDDEPDEQAFDLLCFAGAIYAGNFCIFVSICELPPCNTEFAKLYAKKQLSLWNY